MWRLAVGTAAGSMALLAITSESGATDFPRTAVDTVTLPYRAQSVTAAEKRLRRSGYYDIDVERTLSYSFNACKDGIRHHIHVNPHGDLIQVHVIGRCRGDRQAYRGGTYGYRPDHYDDHADALTYEDAGYRDRHVNFDSSYYREQRTYSYDGGPRLPRYGLYDEQPDGYKARRAHPDGSYSDDGISGYYDYKQPPTDKYDPYDDREPPSY